MRPRPLPFLAIVAPWVGFGSTPALAQKYYIGHSHRRAALPQPPPEYKSLQLDNSASVIVASLPAITLRSAAEVERLAPGIASATAGRPVVKLIQAATPAVALDNRILERPALLVRADGSYLLSFRVRHGFDEPIPGGIIADPVVPENVRTRLRDTNALRRSFVTIQIRGFGAIPTGLGAPSSPPALFDIKLCQVRIERDYPESVTLTGYDPRIRDYFDLLGAGEFEFGVTERSDQGAVATGRDR